MHHAHFQSNRKESLSILNERSIPTPIPSSFNVMLIQTSSGGLARWSATNLSNYELQTVRKEELFSNVELLTSES